MSGVSFLPDGALSLPLQDAALLGHHAAYGVGHDERVVKDLLAGLREMAA